MIEVAKRPVKDLRDLIERSPCAEIPGAEEIMVECLHRSIEIWQGIVDGQVACVWGLIPPSLLSNRAYLWLLTTDLVEKHKFVLVRNSQRYIEEALKHWPEIYGDCVVGQKLTMRWLKWLGAEFGEADGGKISFVIRKKVLNG